MSHSRKNSATVRSYTGRTHLGAGEGKHDHARNNGLEIASLRGALGTGGGTEHKRDIFRFDSHELDHFDLQPSVPKRSLHSKRQRTTGKTTARDTASPRSHYPEDKSSMMSENDSPPRVQLPSATNQRFATAQGFQSGKQALETKSSAARPPEAQNISTLTYSDIVSQLRTGEDAIAFFVRHGNNCPVKFVHLNYADTRRFQPYSLVVVDESDVNPEHFTMSSKGVVHVCPGEPSEFLTLSEWMRFSSIFSVISSIPFFRTFLVRKTFDFWTAYARHSRFKRRRAKIGKKSVPCGAGFP
eukprot:gb/GECG01005614.1/.p1 GENE.gb/GECG01005614.1/~~gb/GECG01005614.1/.p1  ORF type:complete len:299 (+),score=25.64 gb/GECG01005614.1/:1-897(+)